MFFIGQNLKRLRVIYSCNELLLFFWLTFLFEVWFDLDVDVEEPMSFLMQKKHSPYQQFLSLLVSGIHFEYF